MQRAERERRVAKRSTWRGRFALVGEHTAQIVIGAFLGLLLLIAVTNWGLWIFTGDQCTGGAVWNQSSEACEPIDSF